MIKAHLKMDINKKRLLSVLVGAVGFFAAIVGLWDKFIPSPPVADIKIVPKDKGVIHFGKLSPQPSNKMILADQLLVDDTRLIIPDGGGIVANRIELKGNAEIVGEDFFSIATIITGGTLSSSGTKGKDGGDIQVIAALIDGTKIESNGLNGKNGDNGHDGSNGANGAEGRNGSCKGFGGWRSAHPGMPGGNGENGGNGKPGEDGGNAGNITVLTTYDLLISPSAIGGNGGNGGKGGTPGQGGKGGRGGAGCTGLGGAQSSRPSGADGLDGNPGKAGSDGNTGKSTTPIVRKIDFTKVKKFFEENRDITPSVLVQLKTMLTEQ